MSKKSIVIWNWTQLEAERSNMGDRAILAGMLSSIRTLKGDEIEISVFSSNPEYTGTEYGIKALQLPMSPLSLYSAIKEISRADLVILGPDQLIQNTPWLLYIPFNIWAGVIAKLLGKKVMCYGIGVSDTEELSLLDRVIARLFLNRVDIITVRSERAKLALQRMKVDTPIEVTADAAFGMPLLNKEQSMVILHNEGITLSQKIIVLSARYLPHLRRSPLSLLPVNLRLRYGLLPKDYYVEYERLKNKFAQLADELIARFEAQVVFLPTGIGTASLKDDNFSKGIIMLMKNRDKAKVISRIYKPEEIVAFLSYVDLILTVPFHPIVFGCMAGTPSIALSNNSKIKGIIEDLGLGDKGWGVYDISRVSLEVLIKAAEDLLTRRETLREKLKMKSWVFKQRAADNARIAVDLISK